MGGLRDRPAALRIGCGKPSDEGLILAQFLQILRGHQGGIGNINEGVFADSEPGHVLADLAQDGIVHLFVGAVPVFLLSEDGDLVPDAKRRDQELLEIRTMVFAVALDDLEGRRGGIIGPVFAVHIDGSRVEMHGSSGNVVPGKRFHGEFGKDLLGSDFKKEVENSTHRVVVEGSRTDTFSQQEYRVSAFEKLLQTIQRGSTRQRIQNKSQDDDPGLDPQTFKEILPDDPEVLEALKRIGILNAKGHETFYNCVVFPLMDPAGAASGLYGRSIDRESGLTHLYLPGPRRGLVNRQAATRSQTVLLTESVIDALTLYDQGFKNVVPLYGVNGLTEDHLSFFNGKVKEAYLVFDADEAGRRCIEAVSSRLRDKGIQSFPVSLPVKDVNVFFKRHTPEEFEALLKKANPKSREHSETVRKREQRFYRETEHGFLVGYGDRQYEVKGIQRGAMLLN